MEEKVVELIEKLKNEAEEERRYAIEDLADIRDPLCIPFIFNALKDVSIAVREAAVDALVMMAFQEVSEEAYLRLVSEDVFERNYACEILERLGEISVPVLLEKGLFSPDLDILKFAIDILGRIRYENQKVCHQVIEKLSPFMVHSKENIAIAAAESLGLFRDPIVVPSLIRQISATSPWVQCSILTSLEKFEGFPFSAQIASSDLKPLAQSFLSEMVQKSRAS